MNRAADMSGKKLSWVRDLQPQISHVKPYEQEPSYKPVPFQILDSQIVSKTKQLFQTINHSFKPPKFDVVCDKTLDY